MTRFARVHSNREKNTKKPEEGTSWLDFKKQMSEKHKATNNEVEEQSCEEREDVSLEENANFENSWCEFEDNKNNTSKRKSKKKIKSLSNEECFANDDIEKNSLTKRKAEQKFNIELESKFDLGRKSMKKPKRNYTSENEISYCSADKEIITRKRPKKHKDNCEERVSEDKSDQVHAEENNKQMKKNQTVSDGEHSPIDGLIYNKDDSDKRNKKCVKDKPSTYDMSIVIDGTKEKIIKFDGFYILEKEAARLNELKKRMVKEKRPNEEINAIIKRHRRNAEKILSRKKRKLCFNCREGEHVLSECPKLGKNGGPAGSGLCYKCGSTEHTLYQCKVSGNELKFAKCFICNEVGHLSKQCPDNPRGLYPNGGGCRICGDVTHLKRDCPQQLKGRRRNIVTVGTIGDSVEGLDDEKRPCSAHNKKSQKRVNKIVKFK